MAMPSLNQFKQVFGKGSQAFNEQADKDPFIGGIRGGIAGGLTGNPAMMAAGFVGGAIAGEQGKQEFQDNKDLESMLTAEAVKEQEISDKNAQVKDPRKKSGQSNTLLTSNTNTPSLLG